MLARRIRERCRYLAGIELDPEAARLGAPFFDLAIEGNLSDGLEKDLGGPFDVIVAGDILEHLPNPEMVLKTLRRLVKDEGVLLVSLPNVANVTVRWSLLSGRFDYAERGILDKTHLRFFTSRTGRRLVEENGFRVTAVTPTAMPVELAVPALGRRPWAAAARASASGLARAVPGLFAYQFVFEAAPA